MMGKVPLTCKWNNMSATIKRIGLGENRLLEKKLASEIQRTTDPYVPYRQGALKGSTSILTGQKSTTLTYTMPYAKKQYYMGRRPGTAAGDKLRGRRWFERSKADNIDKWKLSAKKFTKE